MKLSIIIPTYNEAENIANLVGYLLRYGYNIEIIVSDGGSADETLNVAHVNGARAILSPNKGRAAQMNFGATIATGDVLYFVHADTFPPKCFCRDIENAISKGYDLGRYQTRFDSNKWLLKVNAFFTRFDLFLCSGGDQTLFITKDLFQQIGGYDNSMHIMEDYDIVSRVRLYGRYKILNGNALVSARKYESNSWWKVQLANFTIIKMYEKGASQMEMVNRYKELLNYR